MQIKLRNIGMLEKAELNLNSLTLIAGENDNGKSTIGKVIFCIIKAINKYKDELQESKEHKLLPAKHLRCLRAIHYEKTS